nr:T9SS type A sorting domain-containing protein [Bacteroidota bacterium]
MKTQESISKKSLKRVFSFIIALTIALTSVTEVLSQVRSQGYLPDNQSETDELAAKNLPGDQNLVEYTINSKSDTLYYFNVPGKPPEHFRAPVAYQTDNAKVLTNVPAYDWSFGCSATSAAMIAGYYDNKSYHSMYTGPTNGGVAPMDNSIWGSVIINGENRKLCPISVTRMGLDGRISRGHVDDYWIKYGDSTPDPFIINGWVEHAYEDCTGDFMKTNQSIFNNHDGSTRFYFWQNGSKWNSNIPDDGGCGFEQFMISRGYLVTERFTQLIYGYNGNTNGFTFSQFKQEIDAGNPVLIHVTGHTMVGYGYDDATNKIYIHDTWDYEEHTMTWGGSYPAGGGSTLNHWGVTVIRLEKNIIYVKWDATGFNNGTSWTDAYTDLHDAITSAPAGYDIWVARGTYAPTGNGIGRYRHFSLKDNVEIYGGFEGMEDPGVFDLYCRNFLANETILTGEADRYHVFLNAGINSTARLDGFTISWGKADGVDPDNPNPPQHIYRGGGMNNDGSSPKIENCRLDNNYSIAAGGGMYNIDSSPAITNCTFRANTTGDNGGGMFNTGSSPVLINCLISGNYAISGGGLGNVNSDVLLINITIAGNLANWAGGGICNVDQGGSTVLLKNSIVWGNQVMWDNNGDYYGHQLYNEISNTITLAKTCITTGGNFHIFGNGNTNFIGCIYDDPEFIFQEPATNAPTTDGDYRLKFTSPAIEAGDNTFIPAGIDKDIIWNPRIANMIVDMGAYEFPEDCLHPTNLAAVNIGSFSADLTWLPGGFENQWVVEYGPTGFLQGTGTSVLVGGLPFLLNGLTPATTYDFYVKADCGGGNTSIWAGPCTFTTSGGPPLTVIPTVAPAIICAGDVVQLNATVIGGSGNYFYSWTSIPPGFISNQQKPDDTPTVNTTYEIVVDDGLNTASATVDVSVIQNPTADAGSDATVNSTSFYTLQGSASDASSVLWTTSGDGTFDDNARLNAKYTPGTNDIQNGLVTLTLSAIPVNPCTTNAFDDMLLTIDGCQTLSIPQGWSGISTWIEPHAPNVVNMFAPIVNDLVILMSDNGIYWPAFNINSIGNWNAYNGYNVKVLNDDILQVCGTPVSSISINLSEGWNRIPVLSSNNVDVATTIGSLPCFMLAKGIGVDQGIYWMGPGGLIIANSLVNLETGKAYWVYVTCDCTFTFPPSTMKGGTSFAGDPQPPVESPWNEVSRTSVSHLIGISDEFAEQYHGKIIGAFNSTGLCTGLTEIRKGNNVLIVYGDDPSTTDTDGMAEGGEMNFKVYDPLTKDERGLSPLFDPSLLDYDSRFVINGISKITYTSSIAGDIAESSVQIYPNPANDFITIVCDQNAEEYDLVIHDITGRIVLNQHLNGHSEQTIDVSGLAPGVYHLAIDSPRHRYIKKLVIQ